jgi:hypothetical protein
VNRRATRPTERQCAMLIVHLLATKKAETEREVTRARLSSVTVQRLFGRRQISAKFLGEVCEWLFPVGWVMFFAGTTYAVVKMDVVQGWGRISSKRIGDVIEKAGRGEFDFDPLEYLLLGSESPAEEED